MENFEKDLIEKYLQGVASKEEAEWVLKFFQTMEGQRYLKKFFDRDIQHSTRDYKFAIELPDADRTLKRIQESISKQRVKEKKYRFQKSRSHLSVWAVAASIAFLVATISILNVFYNFNNPVEEEVLTSVIHSTETGQKTLTLSEGSRIRLNAHSRLEMPAYFKEKIRSVKLDGEAFFEIEHDPNRPFIVETEGAEIRVLGTAFNVRTRNESNNIYVTVAEGKVSVGRSVDPSDPAGILTKDMIGIYNKDTYEWVQEKIEVNNYLSWIHGRIVFDETPFNQVVRQLEHKYEINNVIEDPELLDLRLTADFSERSMKNVLEVISNSLDIKFEQDETSIRWHQKKWNKNTNSDN
ncbi:MAG: FecR domain-containing protein [Balneolaceae bacterium]